MLMMLRGGTARIVAALRCASLSHYLDAQLIDQCLTAGSDVSWTADILKDFFDARDACEGKYDGNLEDFMPSYAQLTQMLCFKTTFEELAIAHNLLRQARPERICWQNYLLLKGLDAHSLDELSTALGVFVNDHYLGTLTQKLLEDLCDQEAALSTVLGTLWLHNESLLTAENMTKLRHALPRISGIKNVLEQFDECDLFQFNQMLFNHLCREPQETQRWIVANKSDRQRALTPEHSLKNLAQESEVEQPTKLINLLQSYRSEDFSQRHSLKIVTEEVNHVVSFLSEHLDFLQWADDFASCHQHQPVYGMMLLQAWLGVASHKNFNDQVQALRQVYAVEQFALELSQSFQECFTRNKAETLNLLLSSVYQKLYDSEINCQWSMLSEERLDSPVSWDELSMESQIEQLTQNIKEKSPEFLGKFACDKADSLVFWGKIAFRKTLVEKAQTYDLKIRFYQHLKEYESRSEYKRGTFQYYLQEAGVSEYECQVFESMHSFLGTLSIAEIDDQYDRLLQQKEQGLRETLKEETNKKLRELRAPQSLTFSQPQYQHFDAIGRWLLTDSRPSATVDCKNYKKEKR